MFLLSELLTEQSGCCAVAAHEVVLPTPVGIKLVFITLHGKAFSFSDIHV